MKEKYKHKKIVLTIFSLAIVISLFMPAKNVDAHCDSIDGPVVIAAQKAIETGNVNYVLPYVTEAGEAEVVAAFEKTMKAQNEDAEIRDTINYWFYETVVRVHRQGEGAAYTGIKPAGIDYGPAIPAAEEAIETGSNEELKRLILTTVEQGIDERFNEMMEINVSSPDDVEAARERAEAELLFEKYIDQLYRDATAELSHESHNQAQTGGHDHGGTDAATEHKESHEAHEANEANEESENSNILYYLLIGLAAIGILIPIIRTIHKKHHKHHGQECDHHKK